MNDVILMRPDPHLLRATLQTVRERVFAARETRSKIPVGVTLPEARVLVAMMNDQWAGRDQSHLIRREPVLGDTGTVFGYPYVVVAARESASPDG